MMTTRRKADPVTPLTVEVSHLYPGYGKEHRVQGVAEVTDGSAAIAMKCDPRIFCWCEPKLERLENGDLLVIHSSSH